MPPTSAGWCTIVRMRLTKWAGTPTKVTPRKKRRTTRSIRSHRAFLELTLRATIGTKSAPQSA